MPVMARHADELLAYFARGDVAAAGSALAAMNRSYVDALEATDQLAAELRSAEAAASHGGLREVEALRAWEATLSWLIVAMVAAVALYGRHIGAVFQLQLEQLRSFNERLDARIRERTVELERGNGEVVALNEDLARNVEHLRDAKSSLETNGPCTSISSCSALS